MAEPFLSEIKIISWNYAPRGWALCNGQLLPINQNQALFALLGTTYGGNGQTTFALPNLQGRAPIHFGNSHTLGEKAGETAHTLAIGELPAHTHTAVGSDAGANTPNPTNAYWASGGQPAYSNAGSGPMSPQAVAPVGGGQAHENLPPYLVLNFCIALVGIFPSRD